ncbi:hypothetical protein BDV09DRAFT_164015 [Aspergillus tetrazonus]
MRPCSLGRCSSDSSTSRRLKATILSMTDKNSSVGCSAEQHCSGVQHQPQQTRRKHQH